MSKQMKGMSQFILDLRNSQDQHEERKRVTLEINNIKQKFRDSNSLSGYQRKKYVCKLIYIYLLGYENSNNEIFNTPVAFQLAQSNVYSEKQVGYLALSVLSNRRQKSLHDHIDDLFDNVHGILVRDLQSSNENFNALAIHFIASNFNISQEYISDDDHYASQWLELIDLVYSFATSPLTANDIKKKSVICLNILLRLYPAVIKSNKNWVPRILSLLDDTKDLGILTSAVHLIEYVSEINPMYVKSTMTVASRRLVQIMGANGLQADCPSAYYYHGVEAPWLIVKLLHLVEHIFLIRDSHEPSQPLITINSLDQETIKNLEKVISHSIKNASKFTKNMQERNSLFSILFQSISLLTFLKPSDDELHMAANSLMRLLDQKDINTRYLSLDALAKLISRSNLRPDVDLMLPKIMVLLKDKDVSIKKKSIDILFTVCNPLNYTKIIKDLLQYFPSSDFSLRYDISVKVAVLAETFAEDSTWYVSTMLGLLSLGVSDKNYVGNEVWERIVQIIVNNEDLHAQSCRMIIPLCKDTTSDNLLKVAAFALGEFGYLVSNEPKFSAERQFQIIYDAYFKASLHTRAMLLSAMLKFVYRYPNEDFIPDIVDLFEVETQSIDEEIQTRGYEYLKLVTNRDILANVIKQFPVFENKNSPLMERIGNKDINTSRRSTLVNASKISGNGNSYGSNSNALTTTGYNQDLVNDGEDEDPFVDQKIVLSPNWFNGYHRMCHYDAGIFFEDQFVKILYRKTNEGSTIYYKFTVINNSAKTAGTSLTGFTVLHLQSQATNNNPAYLVTLEKLPESTVTSKTYFEIMVKVRDVIYNNESPVLSISFKSGGSFNQLKLKFPVSLLRTLSSTSMVTLNDFNSRWLQIGEQLGEALGEAKTTVINSHRSNSSNIVRLLSRLGFIVVHSSPDESESGILVMGAGILHSQKSNYGLLIMVKSADSVGKAFEIVVRCTGSSIASIIISSIQEIFEGKF